MRSSCDCICSDERQFFTNCQIKTPRFDTDHKAIIAMLRLGPIQKHRRYVRMRDQYPIKPIDFLEGNRSDALLEDLKEAATPKGKEDCRSNSWISEATWRLIDQKAAARRRRDRAQVQLLKRSVRKSLIKDRVTRARTAAVTA